MEDRKKIIRDLEARKTETQEAMYKLLGKLGESFLTRLEGGEISPDILVSGSAAGGNPREIYDEKNKCLKEIADSQSAIKAIEANLSRLGDLEELIGRKERENSEKTREISQFYINIGKLVLGDPQFREFSAPFEPDLSDLSLRMDFQKKKLEELENTENGFFYKLANGAKTMVAKSLLAKYQSGLEKLYRYAGEQFIIVPGKSPEELNGLSLEGELGALTRQCEELRKFSTSLKEEIAGLKGERRECADLLEQGGNPTRRISDLEKYISRVHEDIQKIHCRFGSSIRQPDLATAFSVHFSEDEKVLDDKIGSLEDLIVETDKKIEKTKLEIAIDNGKAEGEKLKEAVAEKERLIVGANEAIAGFNGKIAEAEKQLEELQERHGQFE
jgi:hypothetical protein